MCSAAPHDSSAVLARAVAPCDRPSSSSSPCNTFPVAQRDVLSVSPSNVISFALRDTRSVAQHDLPEQAFPCIHLQAYTPRGLSMIEVDPRDWFPISEFGDTAIRFAVGEAIRRKLGIPYRPAQARMSFTLRGREVRDLSSWEELRLLAASGLSCQVQLYVRGGMDDANTHTATLNRTVFDGTIPWEEIDRLLRCIRQGEAIPPAPQDQIALASALAAHTPLTQWDPLTAIVSRQGFRGLITAARMTSLKVLLERIQHVQEPAPPEWVCSAQLVVIRINMISAYELFADAIPHGTAMHHVKDRILHHLLGLFPAMPDSPDYDLRTMESSMMIEGSTQGGHHGPTYLDVTVALPKGPWIQDLLNGTVKVTTAAYATIEPTVGYTEINLDGPDGALLKLIWHTLGPALPLDRYRLLLNDAFRRAFRTDLALTRFTTSRSTGRGQNRTVNGFHPCTADSSIYLGIAVPNLLLTRRQDLRLHISLGWRDERPVEFQLTAPRCPQHVLRAMLEIYADPPLRLRVNGAITTSPAILIGPLPKEWLQKCAGQTRSQRLINMQEFYRVCKQHIAARDVQFVGRREKGWDPLALYIAFANQADATAFLTHADTHTLHPDFVSAVAQRFTQPGSLYCCHVPPEALETVDEKIFRAIAQRATTHPCPLPPPA